MLFAGGTVWLEPCYEQSDIGTDWIHVYSLASNWPSKHGVGSNVNTVPPHSKPARA
jgi:hypothetical protein